MKILLVERFAPFRRVVKKMLDSLPVESLHVEYVDEATDGASALDKLRQQPFDCIIFSATMHGMDSGCLLHDIRADARLAHLPVLMMTTATQTCVPCAPAGASDEILRPFNAAALQEKLHSLLKHANETGR